MPVVEEIAPVAAAIVAVRAQVAAIASDLTVVLAQLVAVLPVPAGMSQRREPDPGTGSGAPPA